LLSFSPAGVYPAGGSPLAVVTGDFNGDGRLDLATASRQISKAVSVLLGNANGTFQPARNTAEGDAPTFLATGDFNRDGKLDVVTTSDAGVNLIMGSGDGSFQAPHKVVLPDQLPPSAAGAFLHQAGRSVAVGDLNGDGKLDLVVHARTAKSVLTGSGYWGNYYTTVNDDYVNVLLGNGDGSFSFKAASHLDNLVAPGAVLGDFNMDGKLDIVAVGSDVSVLRGNGDGTWQPTVHSAGAGPTVVAGDLNGDGKLDLVVGTSVLKGNGDGTFQAGQTLAVSPYPQSLVLGDVNRDGKLDITALTSVTKFASYGYYGGGYDPTTTDSASVLLGHGDGSFGLPVVSMVDSFSGINVYFGGAAMADLSGDGRPDLVKANAYSDGVSVLLNDGVWPAADAPSIKVNDATVTEGNSGTTAATFTVSLSSASVQTVTIHYATAAGSATAGSDFQAASGTLTFAPGATSRTITVLVNGDRVAEPVESFSLLLTAPTNALLADASGSGTVVDDDPYISIAGYSGPEGNSGTMPFTFTVTLSAAYDVPVIVSYVTADLTSAEVNGYGLTAATAGVDYAAKSGTVTFAAGQTNQTITVSVNGDRLGESNESFAISLTGTTAGTIGSAPAFGTILNDEPLVAIGGGGTVVEGNSGTKDVTFTVTLSATSLAPVTVTYATSDGSATSAGGDYRTASGTVTFAAGQTTKTISVQVNGDRFAEGDETFALNLTGATGALITNGSSYATIHDDEPRISINSASVTEGNSGTTLLAFTIWLSAPYDQTVTVNLATHDDQATVAGGDYVAKSGTLTFLPGETVKTFTVTIKGDTQRETDESFYVVLSGSSSNALIHDEYGWGTIVTDEAPSRKRQ
jgi:hypothetical protein